MINVLMLRSKQRSVNPVTFGRKKR